jgi:hypothetical protein
VGRCRRVAGDAGKNPINYKIVVTKLAVTGKLVIITVYREKL